jgi:hypothetical protein
MQLPIYCYFCHSYLQGGATKHQPGCEVLRIIEEAFATVRKNSESEEEEKEEADE